jgi:hypothetical protein
MEKIVTVRLSLFPFGQTWDMFSEESALKYMDVVMGEHPRVAGTPYHLEKTKDLHTLVKEIAAHGRMPVLTDLQMVTGKFYLGGNGLQVCMHKDPHHHQPINASTAGAQAFMNYT